MAVSTDRPPSGGAKGQAVRQYRLSDHFYLYIDTNCTRRRDREGRGAVGVRIETSTFSRVFPAGFRVLPGEWDAARGCMRASAPCAREYNAVLQALLDTLDAAASRAIARGEVVSARVLEWALGEAEDARRAGATGAGQPAAQYFRALLLGGRVARDPRARRRYELVVDRVQAFTADARLEDLTAGWVREWDTFLAGTLGQADTTRGKYHQRLRALLRCAEEDGLLAARDSPYRRVRFPRGRSRRTNVTRGEIERLEAADLAGRPRLRAARDLFLFACYSGLRYGDVMRLSYEHIQESPDGLVVALETQKTRAAVALPLGLLFGGRPERILRGYMRAGATGRVFPQLCNQNLNRQLREAAAAAGVIRHLTFHMARHAFGSMLAETVRDPYLISDLMGHASIRMSMGYIHRAPGRSARELRGVRWD